METGETAGCDTARFKISIIVLENQCDSSKESDDRSTTRTSVERK